ncbi:protein rep [Actinomycetospora sp. CA-101289]|uniref:protein rep n=1 Tax=Actinomycetospora sp. CA-101289 TaxID=3239893 RepID=UPI003D97C582
MSHHRHPAATSEAGTCARAAEGSARAREGAKRPSGGALGNHAHNPSGAAGGAVSGVDEVAAVRDRRAERWALLDAARPVSRVKRLRECRRATLTGTGNPVLRTAPGGRSGFAGLATCGSPWVCPCCSGKIAARRASELAAVMAAVEVAGGVMDLVTFTVRHHQGHRLADVWDAVSAAWARVTSGAAWMEDKAGLLGWARVVEVTHTGRNGWHVHVHALLAWSSPVPEAASAWVAMRGWGRWDRALRRWGFDSTPVHGVDTRRVVSGDEGLAGYFGKAALELTSSWTKDSRAGRSPFALLRDATETYEAGDLGLWWEYEAASHGRKQLTWSTGRMDLRRLAGLGREESDEAVAAEDTGGDDAVELVGETWPTLSRRRWQPELLAVTDVGGVGAAVAWLDERGLPWRWARPYRREGPRPRSVQAQREAREVLSYSSSLL